MNKIFAASILQTEKQTVQIHEKEDEADEK